MTLDPGPIGSASLGAACAIFDSAGRILLVRHTYGKLNWELPGGGSLPAEQPAATAIRELEEETGLSVRVGSLSGVYFEPGHDLGPFVHFVFRCERPEEGEPVAQPPEIGEVGWFALHELPAPMSDFTEVRIADAAGAGASYRVIHARTWRE